MQELCPMHILRESTKYFQAKILPLVQKRHRKLFAFGYSSLTLNHFVSLNSNARMIMTNRSTAESKIYRLVSNTKILSYFPHILSCLNLVKKGDRINIDFSSFCGYEVLTFAKQTSLGRAIPLYVGAITYPITNPGSQTLFIKKEVNNFLKIARVPVHLVFDRGFELPHLVQSLMSINGISFTIRMKKDKHVWYMGKDIPLKNLPWFADDSLVKIYEHTLRIVRSEKKKTMDEPWYLLTNDVTSDRDNVVANYYFRFEIEETFRDLKHIYELNKFYKIKKMQTFLILLWFYILSLWLMWQIPQTQVFLTKRVSQNKHKRLSITRHFYEQLQLFKAHQLSLPL